MLNIMRLVNITLEIHYFKTNTNQSSTVNCIFILHTTYSKNVMKDVLHYAYNITLRHQNNYYKTLLVQF